MVMSFGKKKAQQAQSPFSRVNSYVIDFGDLGSATAKQFGKTLTTTYQASAPLAQMQTNALQGLNSQLTQLNQAPEAQLRVLDQGGNAFYNASKSLLDKDLIEKQSAVQRRFSKAGLSNSTVSGAFQAQLASEASLRDLANKFSSLDYVNQQLLSSARLNQQQLGLLADIAQVPSTMAQSAQMQGWSNLSQTSQFNADQQNVLDRQRNVLYNPSVFQQMFKNVMTATKNAE